MRRPARSDRMLRRGERVAVIGASVAVALIAAAGALSAPARDVDDRRLSTYLAGPLGAKGLFQALPRLGVRAERRRRPYFDVADSAPRSFNRVLAFLDVTPPTLEERVALRNYVTRGGRLFVAGVTGIEPCFGYYSRRLPGAPGDSGKVRAALSGRLPDTRRVLARMSAESLARASAAGVDSGYCPPRLAARVDTLLRTARGDAVAVRLGWTEGGEVTLLADGRYLSNRALKETDAGLEVIPWLLERDTRRVTFDEYHLGFGEGGSLAGASWAWLWGHPLGWAILQLAGVALVVLGAQVVRFGPARAVRDRRRRSPLEHLEALAAGLEGAGGVDTAVRLTVAGLRRRLIPGGRGIAGGEGQWLAALALGVATPRGREAVRRLARSMDPGSEPGGTERLLVASQAVEDVWEELRPRTTRDAF